MRALHAYAKNDPDCIAYEAAPDPVLDADDVLVRVHASGVSPTEIGWPATWVTADGAARPIPIVPGHEVSGVVVALGDRAEGLALGDEVFGLIDFQRDGADADYVAARGGELARKPTSLTHVQAAAVPLSALTAWQALFDHAGLEARQRVLVHGGAGGVGSFAVQFARWRGAHVTATASARDRAFVEDLGATEVIDYRLTRFEDVVRDADVVFDTVGGDTWTRSWGVLRPGGTLVSVAVPRPPIESAPDRVRAVWFVVASSRSELDAISAVLDAGLVRPIVSEVIPLCRGAVAYTRGYRDGPGKIVLDVAGGGG
jgi:NADPH:quinone reductase-like Zn-dependent oxidoreductase